jgi:AraC-like DNA-binding protein
MTAKISGTAFWRDADMPYVESRRACDSRACYKPHTHPTFSIGAVDAGQSCFTGSGADKVLIEAGTIVFVPAGVVHACNPYADAAWSYQMLHLDADWLQGVRDMVRHCAISSDGASDVMVSSDARIYRRFCSLNDILFSDVDVHYKEAELIAFVGDMAGYAFTAVSRDEQHVGTTVESVADVIAHIKACESGTVSLETLASIANMGSYQLIRAFRAATGMTPHAYQLNHRINQARLHLRAGMPVADTAYHLGFADQSHFQRVFKAFTGVPPGVYKA